METMDAKAVLDREFLEMRAKILELAASFDRMDRSEGDVSQDERCTRLVKGLNILLSNEPNRAEQIQLLFSREYSEDWRETYGLTADA